MLIAAAVTLGKLWGAEPHVSPSTKYTGAQSNKLARYGSFTLFLTMFYYLKPLIKSTTSDTATTFNIYHHAPTTE